MRSVTPLRSASPCEKTYSKGMQLLKSPTAAPHSWQKCTVLSCGVKQWWHKTGVSGLRSASSISGPQGSVTPSDEVVSQKPIRQSTAMTQITMQNASIVIRRLDRKMPNEQKLSHRHRAKSRPKSVVIDLTRTCRQLPRLCLLAPAMG